VVPQSPAQTARTNSDAGRGVFIETIHFKGRDANGNNVRFDISPAAPVQVLAFPDDPGGRIGRKTHRDGTPITRSSGTDPNTGSLTIRTAPLKAEEVDACGKKIDSWWSATETYNYNNTQGQTQNARVALRLRGSDPVRPILVYEHTEAPKDGR